METKQRLLSLDAFRGLMIAGMILVNNPGSWSQIYPPLRHAEWHGCTPTDWVFPFFLFIVGVAIPLAMDKRSARGDSAGALRQKIGRRTAVIFGWGLFLGAFPHFGFKAGAAGIQTLHYVLTGLFLLSLLGREFPFFRGPSPRRKYLNGWLLLITLALIGIGLFHYDLSRLRIPGVLQRIALVYGACALLYLHISWRRQLVVGIGLLLFYWLAQTLLPVPGGGRSSLAPGSDLGAWLDRALLGTDHLWRQSKTWDPEGLLSTLPAIVTGISGMLAGAWLQSGRAGFEKAAGLLASGAVVLALGLIWDSVFPINKSLWTSSYVLYTSGIALLLLGVLYWLIDVHSYRRWAQPLVVYGTNALFVFLASGIVVKLMLAIKWVDANGTTQSLRGWLYEAFFTPFFLPVNASLAFAVVHVAFFWVLAYLLHRWKVFIKV